MTLSLLKLSRGNDEISRELGRPGFNRDFFGEIVTRKMTCRISVKNQQNLFVRGKSVLSYDFVYNSAWLNSNKLMVYVVILAKQVAILLMKSNSIDKEKDLMRFYKNKR